MVSLTIPKFFFNLWIWLALITGIIAIHYFWGKIPPPPKPSKFFTRHKKTISKITDILLISVVVFGWIPIIYMFASAGVETILLNRAYNVEPISESLRFALVLSLIPAIPISGISVILIGLLSAFQSNITKTKRIILLIISLLPIIFTILLLLINHTEKPKDSWLIIKLGLGALLGCWLINGPAIFLGKHFFPVSWNIMKKLYLVSGDYPE